MKRWNDNKSAQNKNNDFTKQFISGKIAFIWSVRTENAMEK